MKAISYNYWSETQEITLNSERFLNVSAFFLWMLKNVPIFKGSGSREGIKIIHSIGVLRFLKMWEWIDIGVKLSVPWLIIRARVDLKFQSPVWAEGPYWRLKKFEIGLALMISQGTDNFTPIYTFFSCATMFVILIQVTSYKSDS